MVAAGIEVLCDRPEQRELLRETPGLAVPAVNETMRHSGISNALLRRGRRTRGGPISGTSTRTKNRDPSDREPAQDWTSTLEADFSASPIFWKSPVGTVGTVTQVLSGLSIHRG